MPLESVKDECHFLIDCAEYEDLREEMFRVVDEKMLRDEEVRKKRKRQTKADESPHRSRRGGQVCSGGSSERRA